MLRRLLVFTDAVDWLTEQIGQWLKWLVLFSSLISAFNALMRYTIHYSSNAWLEIQWYMFGAMFLLGAGYALKYDEHVRVDVLFSKMTPKQQAWLDVFGGIFFLMPMAVIIGWLSIPMVINSFRIWEHSNDPGGLLRWPIKIVIPIGFALLAIQGVAEIIKKYAIATGVREPGKAYERPVQ
ncbi:TRAP transporter small permease subunit [Leptospira sp. severe_002]|uniref:TRAP transporter small permease subunit n=1 Tax=Leptospira sp. severe_002 TaxID=2838237 RepID=UPI001E643423|nr:TRAP transporter small permease subunit [Leptospira sp. severe_002]